MLGFTALFILSHLNQALTKQEPLAEERSDTFLPEVNSERINVGHQTQWQENCMDHIVFVDPVDVQNPYVNLQKFQFLLAVPGNNTMCKDNVFLLILVSRTFRTFVTTSFFWSAKDRVRI